MSDGLGRAMGAGVPINFGGETLILDPLTLKDLGVIEQHLLRSRRTSLDVGREQVQEIWADKALPAELKTELCKAAVQHAQDEARKQNTVSREDIVRWLDSSEGLGFTLWLLINKRQPGKYSLEQVRDIVGKLDEDGVRELLKARDQASGIDELGNSTGPAQQKTRKTRRRRRR